MSLAANIAHALGKGKEQKTGDGFSTLCPCHGDTNNSLSIKDDQKNGVIVSCFAGCNYKDVKDTIRSLGLMPEWTPEQKTKPRNGSSSKTLPPPPPAAKEPYRVIENTADQIKAALLAGEIWQAAAPAAADHPYLIRKQVSPVELIKELSLHKLKEIIRYHPKAEGVLLNDGRILIIPVIVKGKISSIEMIDETGIKTALYRGRKRDGYWSAERISKIDTTTVQKVLICEGVATTLSGFQSTGYLSIAALTSGNLHPVAMQMQEKFASAEIIIVADITKISGVLDSHAQEAAEKLGCRLAVPDFGEEREEKQTDINDLFVAKGKDAVRECIDTAKRVAVGDKKESGNSDNKYPPATLDKLRSLNKEYAVVMLGSDSRIAMEGFDNEDKKHTVSFLKTASFYSYYLNSRVMVPVGENGDLESRELAKVWMAWQDRRSYKRVVFDPGQNNDKTVYNLFKGFPLTPTKGDWSLMRGHIHDVICDGNSEYFEYVLAWMARAVQDPGGDKPGVAIVLKGGKGIGKGVFVNYFGKIFGESFLAISDSEGFAGKFNMHLSKALLLFMDEAVWGGDKKGEGKLKQLITEKTILFEPKGIDSISLKNYINIIIAGNDDWVIPATTDERRFFVLKPSENFRQDTHYFGKIKEERRKGGAEAMMYDLLRHDYSQVDLRKAPATEGLSQQVQQSLPVALDFWHSVLTRGFILTNRETGAPIRTDCPQDVCNIDEIWPCEIYKYEVYAEFCQWCKVRNKRYIDNEVHFWKTTWQIWGSGKPSRRQKISTDGKRIDVLVVPGFDDAKKYFTIATKIQFDIELEEKVVQQQSMPFDNQF